MRRLALLAGPILALAFTGAVGAAPRLQLDTEAISAAQCTPEGSNAKQIVDVTFVLQNYGDSGNASEWALDTVNRHLRIWKRSDRTYCAQIQDDPTSTFVTIGGVSPAGGGYVSAGVKGTFQGGYITTNITGKFKATYPTQGNLGTFDAKCDAHFNCPGARPSWLSYFVRPKAEEFAHWGWIYTSPGHGTWLDQSEFFIPVSGDIRH